MSVGPAAAPDGTGEWELPGVWLDAAFQGPLPRRAMEAIAAATRLKQWPALLQEGAWFDRAPAALRGSLARLIGGRAEDVVLGNSTSWGLHVLAWSYPWRPGDEVLVVAGDFPASILPWRTLEARGVRVVELAPAGVVPTPAEVDAALSPATRIFCSAWVGSFHGGVLDLAGIGAACRRVGTRFVLNAAQGAGVLRLDVERVPVDAVSACGWKWTCGPYATGFAWFRPELRAELLPPPFRYWRTGTGLRDLEATPAASPPSSAAGAPGGSTPPATGRLDVFAPANFLNVMAWTAAIDYLLEVGPEVVERHALGLAERVRRGLDAGRFRVASVEGAGAASPLVVFSDVDPERNARHVARLRRAGIHVAQRRGRIRISPHLYNRAEQIDEALAILHGD